MAHSIFDALTGVSLDPSVQSLLESQALITEAENAAGIDQDEEDIFQCGKCKSQFTSLHMFILHKKQHIKLEEQTVDINQYLTCNDDRIHQPEPVSQENVQFPSQETFIQADTMGEPIILEESDMLFSMEQEGASYLTPDSSFSHVPIILTSENLDSFENPVMNPENDTVQELKETQLSPEQCLMPEKSSVETETLVSYQQNNNEEEEAGGGQNLKYKCSYCEKQFSKKFYWQQHVRSHTGEKPYQCVVCGRAFAQKSNVKKHMSSHKVWPGTAIHSLPPDTPPDGDMDRTYHCQFCKEIFDSYKALKRHLIVSHLTLKVYKCVQNSCSLMFAELEDFLEHTRSHKRSEYRCHVCGEVFNTLSDLGLHQYTHSFQKQKTSEKYYCCSVCKSSFANLEALQHHTETTTHNYACPHCSKSFPVERYLRRHLKTHATSAEFTCEDCGKAFKTEQYLANHRLIHSEATPFPCPHCSAKFKRKDRLGRHMLIHDLTKRLKCPFRGYLGCMSEFSRPDKLKRHLLTHSNIKRFNCTHCSRNFHRAQALKHHEINKHNVKCDTCSHAFKSKEQLVLHNCEITATDVKRHRKASGSFKPRKPTPRRQILSKPTINSGDKEKPGKPQAEESQVKDFLHEATESDVNNRKAIAMTKEEITEISNTSNPAFEMILLPFPAEKETEYELQVHSNKDSKNLQDISTC
ncbi:zinc finger protein 341-like [Diprion similis]|uniref:zinc finger protein 341-like n=1 Tax=Diprion similis TaxID=362088 RepID=UPI001EF96C3E|nr:zinc finger protein 341-like [Diprion similis]